MTAPSAPATRTPFSRRTGIVMAATGGLRHGHRQAGRALRRPCRPAEIDRGLLPGDRPRRRDGLPADTLTPLRAGGHAPAAASRSRKAPPPRSRSGWSASASTPLVSCARRPAAAARRSSPTSRSRRAVRQLRSLHGNAATFDGTVEAQKILSAIARTGKSSGRSTSSTCLSARRRTRCAAIGTRP
jgi:hypothetical protein